MDKRTFLFGLGVGIIIGAALLQLMLIGERQTNVMNKKQQESEQPKTYSEAELEKKLEEERARIEAELKEAMSKNPPNAIVEPVNPQPASEQIEIKSEQVEHIEEAKKNERRIVRIPPNSTVTQIADILQKNDVIEDKEAFIDLMRKVIIRAGYFAFVGKPSFEEIKTIVTSQPLPPKEAIEELAKNKMK